jgi:adenine-specific DNA methylase
MEAVREETNGNAHARGHGVNPKTVEPGIGTKQNTSFSAACNELVSSRNIRDVWTINPEAYADAHYATFPTKLVEPMIKVSTSQKGVCPECGSQWARVIESKQVKRERLNDRTDRHSQEGMNSCGNTVAGTETKTLGWRPTCPCRLRVKPVPAVVYDPFAGSGTVGAVAARLGRNYMGSEISPDYMVQAQERIQEAETGIPKDEARNGQMALFKGEAEIWSLLARDAVFLVLAVEGWIRWGRT